MPKGGRKEGSKDKQPREVKDASLAALEQYRPEGTGLPSQVIRTHGEPRALRWWGKLKPHQRAQWVNWLYANQDRIDLTPAEEWGD